MHPHIQSLVDVAGKPSRLAIGLMSGTSLDGLDVALCRLEGAGLDTRIELLEFATVDYSADDKRRIKEVFSRETVDLQTLCILNPWIGLRHADMILSCLKDWAVDPDQIDYIASHGQTVYHGPRSLHGKDGEPNSTLQLGDGDHVAVRAGILTLSDFRQKHIAAGGEGAPLAVFGDYLIFASPEEDRILLNMGGIANLTYLPKTMAADQVFSSDIGTGNTLMDAYIQTVKPGQYFDQDARLALKGTVHPELLAQLKDNSFFDLPMPKTTGPELFNLAYLQRACARAGAGDLSDADIMATLNRFSADMIVQAITRLGSGGEASALYASGGGAHNPLLMRSISDQLPGVAIQTTDVLGINPDAKEAVLFAVLGNETLCGQRSSFGNAKEGIPAVTMGKISFPD